MCLPHCKLHIKWLCRGSSPQRCVKTASVINGKIKKFPSLLSPESLDDTAFDAVSSKLADKPGRGRRLRTLGLRFWRPPLYQLSYSPILAWWTVRDSNPGPTGYEPVALPTELTVHICGKTISKILPSRYRDGNTVEWRPL